MSFDLPHTFYQSVKSVSFLGAAVRKVVPELRYELRSNRVLVYYVCVIVFVHLFLLSLAGKLYSMFISICPLILADTGWETGSLGGRPNW